MNGLRYESPSQGDETANRGQVILMSVSELELDAKSRPPRSSKKPACAGFFVRGGRNVPAHVSPRLESRNDAVRRVRRGREIFACKNIRDQVSSAAQLRKHKTHHGYGVFCV